MKILVTGANGYIGRHVVTALLNHGHDVVACDLRLDLVDSRATKINFDLFNLPEENIYTHLGSPDICLHMAWRNGFVHNSPTQIGDLSAHYKFLTRIIDDGLKHLAVMGTMHEIGYWEGAIDETTPCDPISMYGIAKNALRKAMMLYCAQKDVIIQWLRCYYIIGDDKFNNSVFCKILQAAENGQHLFPFTSGKNKYDFIEIDTLAEYIAAAITQTDITGIINCCSGEPVSLADKVNEFIKKHSLNIRLDYGKYPDRPYDSPCTYGDATKINKIINSK